MRHIDYYTDIVMGKKGGSGGGITPSGTLPISIQENGTTKHDVTQYAEAEITVQVPEPEGTKEINIVQNGDSTEDVKSYANAHIVVAVPEATGEKVIDIVTNGTTTEDVKAFASAKINVNVPQEGIVPSGRLEIAENGVKDVTEYAEVNVQVPVGVFPEGTLEISDNGKQDVTNYAEVNVNVPKGITPEGTKEISVVQNGVTEEDVTEFSKVKITTSVPEPAGTLTINENGKKDVTQYAEVDVQVPAPTGERSVTYTENKTIDEDVSDISTLHVTVQVPESGSNEQYEELLKCMSNERNLYSVTNERIQEVRPYAFYKNYKVTNVSLPNCTYLGDYSFSGCSSLKTISAPKVASCSDGVFQTTKVLTSVEFPVLEIIRERMFEDMSGIGQSQLTKVKCISAKTLEARSFNGCKKIQVIDVLGGDIEDIANGAEITSLVSFVVRKTDGVSTLASRVALPATTQIYVPDELVEQYKVATNWSKYASQIVPLSTYQEV